MITHLLATTQNNDLVAVATLYNVSYHLNTVLFEILFIINSADEIVTVSADLYQVLICFVYT